MDMMDSLFRVENEAAGEGFHIGGALPGPQGAGPFWRPGAIKSVVNDYIVHYL